eukprot:TRINITY_DN7926_c0_g8_i2.p1 TRINITY_DN7926_c0_g8~~TRINITY_DN7926_c0_g8_i2.p1  ORF type:complete len:357 (-),score=54.73 TRINITY_DN7926_c0_g8_i2:60-1130(-)
MFCLTVQQRIVIGFCSGYKTIPTSGETIGGLSVRMRTFGMQFHEVVHMSALLRSLMLVSFLFHMSRIVRQCCRRGIHSLFPLTSGAAQGFIGGVLLPNGKVVLVPGSSHYVVTLDPVAMTVIEHPQDLGAGNKFYGGVLLPNGKVFFSSYSSGVVGLFDPAFGTTVTKAAFFGFQMSVLLPDGRVLCVPTSSDRVAIYDSTSDQLVVQSASGPHKGTTDAFRGGILLPNGNVLFVPYNYFTIVMYNSTSDQFILSETVTNPVATMFVGGCLLPNGIAVFAPYSSQRLGFFDYHGGVNGFGRYFEGDSFGSSDFARGATLLTTGQVVVAARDAGYIGILNTNMNAKEMATHPSFNKY